ncbi:AP-5 complex subunit beta-1 [Syngnathoides biaculeatus]|uniref:AP-5 complex subunit beta-1 n=1 Tax=Syngnathoides biaculeatus TaxID=300417 RepID=UPI002ADE0174|nr:AP-5 complex subunit beta-1 [Syngnathoides biaculeatus]
MAVYWTANMSSFPHHPSQFISKSADTLLTELLRDLRDDKVTDNNKVYLLSPLCEQPALLCPTVSVGLPSTYYSADEVYLHGQPIQH